MALELTLDEGADGGKAIRLDALVAAIDSVSGLLEVETRRHPAHPVITWVVGDLRIGSAVLGISGDVISGPPGVVGEVARRSLDLVDQLEHGWPLSDEPDARALQLVERLKAAVASHVLRLRTGDAEVRVTASAVERARAMGSERTESFGSIEGVVEMLSVHGREPKFRVYRASDGRGIEVTGSEDVFEMARESLRKRVVVSGRLRRNVHGMPESMEAWEMEVLPPDSELPQASNLKGILLGDAQRG